MGHRDRNPSARPAGHRPGWRCGWRWRPRRSHCCPSHDRCFRDQLRRPRLAARGCQGGNWESRERKRSFSGCFHCYTPRVGGSQGPGSCFSPEFCDNSRLAQHSGATAMKSVLMLAVCTLLLATLSLATAGEKLRASDKAALIATRDARRKRPPKPSTPIARAASWSAARSTRRPGRR